MQSFFDEPKSFQSVTESIVKSKCRTIHPFPARMAPSIALNYLPRQSNKPLTILDPMVGSGTTMMLAKMLGHKAIGFDTDPLATLISSTWCAEVKASKVQKESSQILEAARKSYATCRQRDSYPIGCDPETKKFIRYWFDVKVRKELTVLSNEIAKVKNKAIKNVLWCAFSRLIITKKNGASLAMDISHSRPHKVYSKAPISPFEKFLTAVEQVLKGMPFVLAKKVKTPRAIIRKQDARKLCLKPKTIDFVITSPPYLNAIDYLRGHKLSLVWMGLSISTIRNLRSTNIGSEVGMRSETSLRLQKLSDKITITHQLSKRENKFLLRYLHDMDRVLSEIARVLKPKGKAVIVIGDSTLKGTFVENSKAIKSLGCAHGLSVVKVEKRPIPANQRYLPPPENRKSGTQFSSRMGEEVIICFEK